jgi:predicted small lipoprotein YifL
MHKISRFARILAAICLMTALSGCGQKGNLYLPDAGIIFVWLG